jgi:membrane fusion protein, multidrug efflux system
MRRSVWIVTLLAVLAAFAVFQQYSSWSLNKSQVQPGDQADNASKVASGDRAQSGASGRGGQSRAGRSRDAIPVLVAVAQKKTVPVQIRAVGNVEAYATVSIKSQVTGVLTQAHFKEGQDVKKGQLLFTIDPRPLDAALKQAQATLARDFAQVQNWREQVKRYAELVKQQYVSREQYDQIKANADAAEAVIVADQAAVENAKVQLSYCYIYSPMSGRVGSLLVNEGNLVRVNDGAPLVVINQLTPIFVTFSVPEQNLEAIKRHMAAGKLKVEASFASDEGRPEDGVLAFVDNAVDRSTGTIKLKAEFTNAARRLWPGQFVNIALTLSTQPDAVVIPSEAIQVGPEGQHVFVIKSDKHVEVRSVVVGLTNEGESVIVKGLAPGEQIVREGQFLLGPDSRVEVKDEARTLQSEQIQRQRGGKGKEKS